MNSLIPANQIVSAGLEDSTLKSIAHAKRLSEYEFKRVGLQEPISVSPISVVLVLNVLHKYSSLAAFADKPQELESLDSVACLISALRWIYKPHAMNLGLRYDELCKLTYGTCQNFEVQYRARNYRKVQELCAYLRYTEGFNDLGGCAVPDFNSLEAFNAHSRAQMTLDEILDKEDLDDVEDWLDCEKRL
eukprot:IDg22808t1